MLNKSSSDFRALGGRFIKLDEFNISARVPFYLGKGFH